MLQLVRQHMATEQDGPRFLRSKPFYRLILSSQQKIIKLVTEFVKLEQVARFAAARLL